MNIPKIHQWRKYSINRLEYPCKNSSAVMLVGDGWFIVAFYIIKLKSVVGSVIQAYGRSSYEDGVRY